MTALIQCPPSVCGAPAEGLRREWLETNGTGAYASSTILNCHTRKYHGLLVASLAEPPGRFVLLSKFEDSVLHKGAEFFLCCHQYPGLLFPDDRPALWEYRQAEGPCFLYRAADAVVEKRILLLRGANRVLVRYAMLAGDCPVALRLRPFLAYRDHHALSRENSYLRGETRPARNGFIVTPYDGMPPLCVQASARVAFHPAPVWYRRFEYVREAERGYPAHEDLFQPGVLELALRVGRPVIVSAGLGEQSPAALRRLWEAEVARRRGARLADTRRARRHPVPAARRWLPGLLAAARQFLARVPPDRPTVIAGYPWFADWGRDTLIALPGLTFYAGRPAEGLAVLTALAAHERNGLLPNCFAADGLHHAYNAADASLWFFWAVQQMLARTGNRAPLRPVLWPTMKRILAAYMHGTENHITMNEDGLLRAGSADTQVTWMDARVDGRPVTPRHGYAVDLNALWYNAVCFAEELAAEFGEAPAWPADLVARMRRAFARVFWLEAGGYLADAVSDGELDPSIRPNQILAVSLPHSPLTPEQRERVVAVVREALVTPYGLRTLSPADPAYRGRYEGDGAARDRAYHQGTVWPWLVGHFGEACLRVARRRAETVRFLVDTFRSLYEWSLEGPGLGQVAEVFDGDPPHRPNGCFAQAWSTAELIRLLVMLGAPEEARGRRSERRGRREDA